MKRQLRWMGCVGAVMAVSMACAGETLIVRARKGFSAVPTESRAVRSYAEVNEVVISVPNGWSDDQYAAHLRASGRYEYVSLNPVVRPCRRPDDPKFPFQWHHTTMQSERAWDIRSGLSSDVVVGLVDTGVDLTHPDLASNLVSGWDMISNQSQASGGDVQDDEGHGTAMAGLIAAKGNNGLGVTGMGWGIKIMPIKVIDGATLDQLLAGARKAADLGCKVVNVSYEGVAQQAVETTGQYCKTKDSLLVYSAGNNGANLSFDYPSVIIVGGSNQQDQLLAGSAYGQAIDLVAPGSTLLSTARYGKYDYTGGTSASAAITSGVAAMTRWVNPYMTWETWSNNLVRGTVDLGLTGEDTTFGWGRISLYRATKRVVPLIGEVQTFPSHVRYVYPTTIDDEGTIYGTYSDATFGSHPFAKSASQFYELPVPTVPDGVHIYGADREGRIYGWLYKDQVRKYYWWATHTSQPIEIPMPGPASEWQFDATRLHRSGVLVGKMFHHLTGGSTVIHAALVSRSEVKVLSASSLDYSDSVVGMTSSGNIFGTTHGQGCFWDSNGNVTYLPTIQGSASAPLFVTESGSYLASTVDVNVGAFLVNQQRVLSLHPPAGFSTAFGSMMNDSEQVIGYYDPYIEFGYYPAIWNEEYSESATKLLATQGSIDTIVDCLWINTFGSILAYTQPSILEWHAVTIIRPLYNQGQGGLTVNCSVILADYPGDPFKTPVTIKLYQNGTLKETLPNLVPGSNGYKFTTLLRGNFTVMLSAPHFLTKRVSNFFIDDEITQPLDATLTNGDIDGDNEVGLFDYLILSEAFDSTGDLDGNPQTEDPSPDWDPMADLDGDNTISLFDYLILSENFDKQGDTLQ